MKSLIIIALLLCSAVCGAEDKPQGMSDYDWGYAKGYARGLEDYPKYNKIDESVLVSRPATPAAVGSQY
jgi:hypothetical protein